MLDEAEWARLAPLLLRGLQATKDYRHEHKGAIAGC